MCQRHLSRILGALVLWVMTLFAGAALSLFRAQLAESHAQATQFFAVPTSGRLPLSVTFCASAGIAIDFGDGTSVGMGPAPAGACPAGLSTYALHTYAAPGAYHLRGSPCPSSVLHPGCGEAAVQANEVTITVSGAP